MSDASYSSDSAEHPGMDVGALDNLLWEIRLQPQWRREADIDCDFYDGNQIDRETLSDMESLGMAPLIRNLIKPTIDAVLGMEAKTRTDWRVQGSEDKFQDVAEALTVKLNEAERESHADRACSDAYAGQLKAGLAWVEVSREMNPFEYPYRVEAVNRREIFWDWRAKSPQLKDARYLVRRRWLDCDILELMFPDQKELVSGIGFAKANWDTPINDVASMMARSYIVERDLQLPESDWRDTTRKRLCLYEVWYRVWKRGFVIRTPDGRTVEVDLDNPRHAQAVAQGMVQPVPAIFPKMRLSWWVGPHRLADMPTPYKHQNFPYIPFWGYREDLTQVPYGLIRSMRSPQDEINARLSKMYWLLSAKRVTMTADAVDDVEETRNEIARPDAFVVLGKNFKPNSSKFEVDSNMQLSDQQFKVLEEAINSFPKSSGVYNSVLGEKQAGVTAGVAINSLVEQGTTTLAEINDNFRDGHRMVADALLELIREDMGQEPAVVNVDEKFGTKKRAIQLNTPTEKNGVQLLDNDIQRALVKTVLEDVPSTPTFRAQQLMMLSELTKSLPPQIQAFVVPFIIEASEMPHRRDIADQVRKALGMGEGGQDQTFTKEQMQAEIEKAVEAFKQQSGLDLKAKEIEIKGKDSATKASDVAMKAGKLKIDAFDAETRRLVADATVLEKVHGAEMSSLDMLLQHDQTLIANQQPAEAAV